MSNTFEQSSTQAKRVVVSSKERSYVVGDVIGVNGYRVNRTLLVQRFAEGGYKAHETAHFLIFTRVEAPTLIIVHWFAPEEIDADIGQYFLQELKPIGVLRQPQDFADIFGSVVCSLFPQDIESAWYSFATNTLGRYHDLLQASTPPFSHSPISIFASLYRCVLELDVGESLLDAGCLSGMLPLIVAEHLPLLIFVAGIDIRSEPFAIARRIAMERHLSHVQFMQADLLEDLAPLGRFDTVTALHVLEHFSEAEMYAVLTHLLMITKKQLVLAVPYELEEPEIIYKHKQTFTRAKLEGVGQWCLQKLEGAGKVWYKECEGGLLVIERHQS